MDPPRPSNPSSLLPDRQEGSPPPGDDARVWFEQQIFLLLPELRSAALHFTHNRADAEDLVAEAVAKAWEHLPSLADPARFRGWVFRILSNSWISVHRARRSRPVERSLPLEDDRLSLLRSSNDTLLGGGMPAEQDDSTLDLAEDLARAIDALPEHFRAAVLAVVVEGLSYRDAARALGLPIGTLRSRLFRGRARLRELLRERGWRTGLPQERPI
jgi:RNA polymerase sigma-70 factor, ECF subfamily